jgi:hypothetical protein
MAAIKLTEQYAIDSLRRDVRDALIMAGEPCILLQMYHPQVDKDAPRCPNCQDDIYTGGEGDCTICYGTSVEGGIKAARRVWGLFSDHIAAEQYTRQGAWPPDAREIQTEAFPLLLEHDIVIRVRDWDEHKRPLEVEGFFNVAAVTRTSLRTGSRSGQQTWDVVGQRSAITLVNQTLPIVNFPVVGRSFEDVIISPNSFPVSLHNPPVVMPDTRVVFIPVQEEDELSRRPFTHLQHVAASQWQIVHQLDHLPSVTVIVNQELVEPDVFYPNPTTVRIEFENPTAGIAVLV